VADVGEDVVVRVVVVDEAVLARLEQRAQVVKLFVEGLDLGAEGFGLQVGLQHFGLGFFWMGNKETEMLKCSRRFNKVPEECSECSITFWKVLKYLSMLLNVNEGSIMF